MTGQPVRDLAALAAGSNEADFLFAVAHVGSGRVGDLTRTGTGKALAASATVTDTPRRRVRLTATTASCPCPTGKRARTLCEHAIAVGLTDLVAATGTSITDLTARWFAGDLTPPRAVPTASRASASTGSASTGSASTGAGAGPGTRDVRPGAPSGRRLASWEEVDLRDLDDPDDDWDDDLDNDWDEWDFDDPDRGPDREPADLDAVRRFLAGLTGDQARGLLLALASDLPEVADTLLDLGRSPGAPAPGGSGQARGRKGR